METDFLCGVQSSNSGIPPAGAFGGTHTNGSPHSLVIRLPPLSPAKTLTSTQLPTEEVDTIQPPSWSSIIGMSPTSTQLPTEEVDFLQRLDPSLTAGSETDASPSKGKRLVPSAANALYGFVDGVGRGNSASGMF